jgi:hypothetical protein
MVQPSICNVENVSEFFDSKLTLFERFNGVIYFKEPSSFDEPSDITT